MLILSFSDSHILLSARVLYVRICLRPVHDMCNTAIENKEIGDELNLEM